MESAGRLLAECRGFRQVMRDGEPDAVKVSGHSQFTAYTEGWHTVSHMSNLRALRPACVIILQVQSALTCFFLKEHGAVAG